MKNLWNKLPDFLQNPDSSIYTTGRYVVVDFETTNIDKGSPYNPDNKMVVACWYTSWDGEYHVRWGNEYEQGDLVKACEEADFIVAHYSKFELGWLQRCGLDIYKVLPF